MKTNVPWSVKGIDPEARVVAKEAARKAGMTLGEWMTSMIQQVGADESDGSAQQQPLTGVTADQLRAVVDSLNRLNERLKSTEDNLKRTEEKSRQAVGGLNQGLETVFERLKRVEREKSAAGATPQADAGAPMAAPREHVESLKALEGALSQMVEQFEKTRSEALTRVAENEQAVAALSSRVDGIDQRLDEGFQEVHDALDAVGSHLDHTERTAKAVMLEAREAAHSSDAEFVERTGKKLQLLGNEIKRSGDQIAAVESMVASLSEKIEAAETRSADGIADIAADIAALREDMLAAEVEASEVGATATEAEETVAALQKSYEDMIARLEGRDGPTVPDGDGDAVPSSPAPAPLMADPAPAEAGPSDTDVIDEDEEFDAVFDRSAETPAPTPPNDPETPATDDETPVDFKSLSPREKILAAAKARKARLEAEKAAADQADQDEGGDDSSILIDDTQSASAPLTASLPEVDELESETGRNRKLGLPLVGLLGLLLAAIVAAAALFFGMGKKDNNAADEPTTAATEQPGATANPSSATLPQELINAADADPDPVALYNEGKALMASASNEDQRFTSFEKVREAALYGYVPAKWRLGEYYFTGYGTDRNLQSAKRWYAEAAASGNAISMHRLGTLAIDPSVDGRDLPGALDWFGKAANHGVVDSMYNLGFMYDPNTDILPPSMHNPELSYFWYGVAAKNNDEQAAIDAATVAAVLPANKVAELDAEVSAWAPLPYNAEVNDGLTIQN